MRGWIIRKSNGTENQFKVFYHNNAIENLMLENIDGKTEVMVTSLHSNVLMTTIHYDLGFEDEKAEEKRRQALHKYSTILVRMFRDNLFLERG